MQPPKYQSWDNPRCEILKKIAEAKPMSHVLCLECKGGRLLCGRESCPLLAKIHFQSPIEQKLGKTLFGPSPPSLFVGWMGYPNVLVGPMASVDAENPQLLDNPAGWYGADFNDIIRMRSALVRSKSKEHIKSHSRLVSDVQELSLSVQSVDVELEFKHAPKYSLSFSPIQQPMGPAATLEKFTIAENTKIPLKAERIVRDDLKATESAALLYAKDFDIYYISKVLSAGVLGMNAGRKLVPTRWSITATDDILAKEMLKKIRQYSQISEYLVYSNTYLENHFEVLLMPGAWSFEQFEAWSPNTLWTLAMDKPTITQECESFEGRTKYAIKEGGGYYAGRFAVCEQLEKMKKQATAVIFREIYESYVMPVGVWEVRENVRHAFENKPRRFATMKDALADIRARLHLPLEEYLRKSALLRQRKLSDF